MRKCEDCANNTAQFKVRHMDSHTIRYVCGHCNMHGGRYCTIERIMRRLRRVAVRKVQPVYQSYAVHWD